MHLGADRLQEAAHRAGLRPASLVVLPLDLPAEAITVEPDLPLYPASMIKVPLVAAALAEIGSGYLASLESTIIVDAANMTANDASSPLQPGYVATLHELMGLAISRSDNVATNILFDLVDRVRATDIVRDRYGLRATQFHRKLSGGEPLIADPEWDGVHRNSHPASDAAHLLRLIADDAIPLASILREALAAQEWNNKLSLGLRSDDRFAHKTGDTTEVTHDAGILTTAQGAHYVVVAYTGLPSTDENNARFATFMQAVRDYL
jgi:beta-lactamase class A